MSQQPQENHFPFGLNPTEQEVEFVTAEARKVYEGTPETTCCHKAECCNAGCPNMYFSEFLSIRRGMVDNLSKTERVALTVECIRRYLYNQDAEKPKPCVFLGTNNLCKIYPYRHLKCRLYGVIPDSLYAWIVDSVSRDMNVPKEKLPLCNQCPNVKVKPEFAAKFPDNKVPESEIRAMELRMRELDRSLGLSKQLQDQGFGFLTYHDWHLLFEFGEDWMVKLTSMRTKLGEKEKEQFIEALKNALEKQATAEPQASEEAGKDGKQ